MHDLVLGQLETQGPNVILEVFDLAAADQREHIAGLRHDVS